MIKKYCFHLKQDNNQPAIKVIYNDEETYYCLKCFEKYTFENPKKVQFVPNILKGETNK